MRTWDAAQIRLSTNLRYALFGETIIGKITCLDWRSDHRGSPPKRLSFSSMPQVNTTRRIDTRINRPSLRVYVFYHDKAKLDRVSGGVASDSRFEFVDLNDLPIPDALRIAELDEPMNRALFSEYLGLLSVNADLTDMVGLFTYSIPLKFSREWADNTGRPDVFLPEISFDAIARAHYRLDHLYGVEFRAPWRKFPNEIARIHQQFRVGGFRISPLGPYKASIIVDSRIFRDFLLWFKEVFPFLVKNTDWQMRFGENSPFSASDHAAKTQVEIEIDRIRHGLGGVLERAVAYFFGQRFSERYKCRLGPYLARLE